ncbi:hypothetical protein DIS18_04805 [Algibacter marinivivus]|uniref:Uncharacterized protein n=1 Tax=Algibacter marinivivus TaxID=2100723 RepID=A0A2U2X7W4_9FLAO|nr:heparinase II/III-family protein [Algibacter marinivivus]PWH83876.1 hypothetical protein DIS18_04805 [Algibacter marinivivus]
MDRDKVILLIHTVKYLKLKQVYYRLYYLIKDKIFNKKYHKNLPNHFKLLKWEDLFLYQNSFFDKKTFLFLNIEHTFENEIDWNFSEYGKLWTFNLNYFDFLNQESITIKKGVSLIKDYISNKDLLKDGKESYTISLRGINWVKFLSKNNIRNQSINQTLYNHYQRLLFNQELHFLGNHYLENGFSLLFGAYYFQDEKLYKSAKKILKEELEEEILKDGGHFELSPMYHQTILHRVLDCYNLVKHNHWKSNELELFLEQKAINMLSWLEKVTFKNGNIPMVNDSTYGIAPTSKELFNYAKLLKLSWSKTKLSDSGYRKISNDNYELFVDVGHIGVSYQPAHVHSDTFNFELYVNGTPVIVDTGTSTYEKNELRQLQRSTESHNTVKIGNINQSQVWSGFRVAERAKIVYLKESSKKIEATHDGYKKLNILHTRKFISKDKEIIIEDKLSKNTNNKVKAFLHFHPSISISKKKNSVILSGNKVSITFSEDVNKINILEYDYALGFNKTAKAQMIEIEFIKMLKTQIFL